MASNRGLAMIVAVLTAVNSLAVGLPSGVSVAKSQ